MHYMTVDELKDYIKKSKSTIYKLTSSNEIPHLKKGGLLFKKEEIDKWLEHSTVPSKDQIENNIPKLLKPIRNGNSI